MVASPAPRRRSKMRDVPWSGGGDGHHVRSDERDDDVQLPELPRDESRESFVRHLPQALIAPRGLLKGTWHGNRLGTGNQWEEIFGPLPAGYAAALRFAG